MKKQKKSKVLIYDIETSRTPAMVWSTGKQYIRHDQLLDDPKIITIVAKWLGEDDIFTFVWDKNQSDKKLMKQFLKLYNDADMVIGFNNNSYDNKWINARAMKYGMEVNTHIKSFDIMREAKRLMRIPSYSMDYMCRYFEMEGKYEHSGIKMWDMIQSGTKAEQEKYLQEMCEYNRIDVIRTEELFTRIRRYSSIKVHFGVLEAGDKLTCPNCGSKDIELYKTTTTPAGTIQRVMQCNVDKSQFKMSNSDYINFLTF